MADRLGGYVGIECAAVSESKPRRLVKATTEDVQRIQERGLTDPEEVVTRKDGVLIGAWEVSKI